MIPSSNIMNPSQVSFLGGMHVVTPVVQDEPQGLQIAIEFLEGNVFLGQMRYFTRMGPTEPSRQSPMPTGPSAGGPNGTVSHKS
jgi:hypothetical protein